MSQQPRGPLPQLTEEPPKEKRNLLMFGRVLAYLAYALSLIHISEPTRRLRGSRMPSSA